MVSHHVFFFRWMCDLDVLSPALVHFKPSPPPTSPTSSLLFFSVLSSPLSPSFSLPLSFLFIGHEKGQELKQKDQSHSCWIQSQETSFSVRTDPGSAFGCMHELTESELKGQNWSEVSAFKTNRPGFKTTLPVEASRRPLQVGISSFVCMCVRERAHSTEPQWVQASANLYTLHKFPSVNALHIFLFSPFPSLSFFPLLGSHAGLWSNLTVQTATQKLIKGF